MTCEKVAYTTHGDRSIEESHSLIALLTSAVLSLSVTYQHPFLSFRQPCQLMWYIRIPKLLATADPSPKLKQQSSSWSVKLLADQRSREHLQCKANLPALLSYKSFVQKGKDFGNIELDIF